MKYMYVDSKATEMNLKRFLIIISASDYSALLLVQQLFSIVINASKLSHYHYFTKPLAS